VDRRCGSDPSQLCAAAEDRRRDAGHILKLLMESRFPRLWTPNSSSGLAAVADPPAQAGGDPDTDQERIAASGFERGVQKKSACGAFGGGLIWKPFLGWLDGAAARRSAESARELDRHVDELDQAVKQAACEHPQARLLMTQPGVGRLRRWRLC